MTPTILQQAEQLRNITLQLRNWLPTAAGSESKQFVAIIADRAEALLRDIRIVSPSPEREPLGD